MHVSSNNKASLLNPCLVLGFPQSMAMIAMSQLYVSRPTGRSLSPDETCLNINKLPHPDNITVFVLLLPKTNYYTTGLYLQSIPNCFTRQHFRMSTMTQPNSLHQSAPPYPHHPLCTPAQSPYTYPPPNCALATWPYKT
jgi:hypothetical protein